MTSVSQLYHIWILRIQVSHFRDDYPHFTDEQAEAQRGRNLTTVAFI